MQFLTQAPAVTFTVWKTLFSRFYGIESPCIIAIIEHLRNHHSPLTSIHLFHLWDEVSCLGVTSVCSKHISKRCSQDYRERFRATQIMIYLNAFAPSTQDQI